MRVWARKLISLHTHVEGHTAASAPREGRWRVDGTSPPPYNRRRLRPSAPVCCVSSMAMQSTRDRRGPLPSPYTNECPCVGYRRAGDGPALHRPRSDGYQARRIGSPTVCKSHCPWEPSSTIALWVPPRRLPSSLPYSPCVSCARGTWSATRAQRRGQVPPRAVSARRYLRRSRGIIARWRLSTGGHLTTVAAPWLLGQ